MGIFEKFKERKKQKEQRRREDIADIKNGHGERLTKTGQGDYAKGYYYNKKTGRYLEVSDREIES